MRGIKTAILKLAFGMAVFSGGCAPIRDTSPVQIIPAEICEPVSVAVLPPSVHAQLSPECVLPLSAWYEALLDGRGVVVASETPDQDAGVALVSTLSLAQKYKRVFLAINVEEARELGADRIISWTIHDYRCIALGANRRFGWVVLLGPLVPQYWVRWLTIEARLDWEVQMTDAVTGKCIFDRRLKAVHYKTVRYALGGYFNNKMLRLLLYEASPRLIAELFQLDMKEECPKPEPSTKGK